MTQTFVAFGLDIVQMKDRIVNDVAGHIRRGPIVIAVTPVQLFGFPGESCLFRDEFPTEGRERIHNQHFVQ